MGKAMLNQSLQNEFKQLKIETFEIVDLEGVHEEMLGACSTTSTTSSTSTSSCSSTSSCA